MNILYTKGIKQTGAEIVASINAQLGSTAWQGGGGGGGDLVAANNLSDLDNVSTARTNLGLVIGTDVQAYDADLLAIGALAKTDGNLIVGNGSTWVAESGATARLSLGLGDMATKDDVSLVDINATGMADSSTFLRGDWTWAAPAGGGGGDLLAANNLSDVSNVATARDNLGVEIGVDVQAYSAALAAIAGLTATDSNIIVGNGSTWVAESGSTARTSLGLGSLATASTINNTNWSGTDLSIANGGTGASTDVDARTNLGLVIGTNVQAYSADLTAIASLAKTDGNIIVGNGSTWVAESGATARASLGLDGSGIASLLDTQLSNTRWREGFVNAIGAVENITTGVVYTPSADTDAARGVALTNALAAVDTNEEVVLAKGFTYVPAAAITVIKNFRLRGNGACIKRGSSQTAWVLCIDAPSGGITFVDDLEIHGNYGGVALTTVVGDDDRGEGIRVQGGGKVILRNVYSHDSPIKAVGQADAVDDAAVNFMVAGSGHKKLINCIADNPSYANYRIQATTSEFIGCDSFVTTFTGNYGRFYVMDGANVRSCVINGGTWKTDQSMKINANFDPSTNSTLWCERLVLTNIIMDFGTGHSNTDGDSFMKFDNCRYVLVSNIVQSHSDPFVPDAADPLTEPGTGFKWWFPTVGVRESVFSVGTCNEVHFENIIADGYVKLTGSSGGPYSDIVSMKNCVWGANAHILFGVENCNHAKLLTIENCSFRNVIGSGTTVKIFDNTQSERNQKIRIKNCFITTFWQGIGGLSGGFLFGRCDKIGDIAVDDIDLLDLNTDAHVAWVIANRHWVESSGDPDVAYNPTGSGYPTYVFNTPVLRLMATPRTADPLTAYLHRNVFRTFDYANNKFINGTLATLATSGTYAHTHRTPTEPGAEDGDWFPSVTGDPGTRIINLGGGAGGNGYPNFWLANAAGDFVEDPSIRSDSA